METAIVTVLNDLLTALDSCKSVFLSILDYSVAFDLVSHLMLLQQLQHGLGITDTALKWFGSYLSNRTQWASISGVTSPQELLKCGIPQGPILQLILFTIYTLPLGHIISCHNAQFQLYTNDSQLYMSCNHPQILPCSQTSSKSWRHPLPIFSVG